MTLVLYHHNSSVCAAKVRIALAEKGLAWESRLMALDGDQFEPAYLALNPGAVVPTLIHDGAAIIESNVILEYLDDAFPYPALRPADPMLRARMRLCMAKLDQGEAGVHKAISVLTYAIAYRHMLIAEAGGTDEDRLREVVARNMNPQSRAWLEPVVLKGLASDRFDTALARMDRVCAEFDLLLADTDWLAGSERTLADIAYTPYMIRLDLLGLSALWQDRPYLADWYERLRVLTSTAEVHEWYAPATLEALEKGSAASRVQLDHALQTLREAA